MIAPEEDVDRIMALMATAFDPAFGEAWSRRQVTDALLSGSCHYQLVGADGGQAGVGAAAGFALSRAGYGEEELLLLAVDPRWRRRGLGHAMLATLVENARSRGARRLLLEMRRGNPAESLYRSCGFAPIGERPNYYRVPGGQCIDALTFALDID
jgi:[ribosomal protein S18]-alanine N-acetyltransferase